jgi:hypothetical protein
VKTRVMPAAELVVRTALASLLGPGVRVATERPANLETIPLYVQVERVGGPRFRFHDEPLLYVSSFAPSRQAALNLAVDAVDDAVMNRLAHTVASGARFQDVECHIGPRFLPYDNALMWRFQASYSLAVCPVG